MQIEIKDELEDRIEEVHNNGVIKGMYPIAITPGEMINKLLMNGLAEAEEKLLTPKEHNCTEHITYSGEYKFIGDAVLFYGKCSVCGKELVHTFYGEKNARETDEGFIHADQWRELTASDIISSIDIGLSVLKEKEGFSKEYHGQLLVLIEEIAKMLAREV